MTHLSGPYALNAANLASIVRKGAPGVYALGVIRADGRLVVQFVGRADSDLNARLTEHAAAGKYPGFGYAFVKSQNEAFETECALYHEYGEASLDNQSHPAASPAATPCAICGGAAGRKR